MNTFSLTQGRLPLLISMPHNGQQIPDDIAATMQPFALTVPDTDWNMHRLYDFAAGLGCSTLDPLYSRYVIDLNRAPDGAVLYANANNTELCPTSAFDLRALYRAGKAPDAVEISRRIETYWKPYHQALQAELARLKAEHGYAILFDAHSIQSQVPRFFDGRLPDINYGSGGGISCAPAMSEAFYAVDTGAFSKILNGRFKGGYITRHYGQPQQGVHSLQLELSQITYMDEVSFEWRENGAQQIKPVLRAVIESLLGLPPEVLIP